MATYEYNLVGNMSAKTMENGIRTSFGYDGAHRLTQIEHRKGYDLLTAFGYTLDKVGNRTAKAQSGLNPLTENYSYDALDQLVQAKYGGVRTVAYQYDKVGNRQNVTENGASEAYTVNADNSYTSVGGESTASDLNGNLISEALLVEAAWALIAQVLGVEEVGAMRLARVRGEGGGGFYHCMSRVVEGRFIFNTTDTGVDGALEAQAFVGLMRRLERFHGMQIVTYAVMSNHFHILVREPLERLTRIGDAELVEKVTDLNGRAAGKELQWRIRHYREELRAPEAAEALKATYLARMGDVSAFLKELKGRFAQWYNRRHGRYGVLWAERFKSVLVEGSREALLTVAAYIDLNGVRAGLVEDPAEYRYCGYGEAVGGGSRTARRGLRLALGDSRWRQLQAAYRMLLYSAGEEVMDEDGRVARRGVAPAGAERVHAAGGVMSVPALLRLRVRYFGAGVVLGSREFVEAVFERHRSHFGLKRRDGARPMRGFGGLRVMRDLRLDVIG